MNAKKKKAVIEPLKKHFVDINFHKGEKKSIKGQVHRQTKGTMSNKY